jgi:hypothetical protein
MPASLRDRLGPCESVRLPDPAGWEEVYRPPYLRPGRLSAAKNVLAPIAADAPFLWRRLRTSDAVDGDEAKATLLCEPGPEAAASAVPERGAVPGEER